MMGICWGDPHFPTPTHTGCLKSKMDLTISSSSSSGEDEATDEFRRPVNVDPFAVDGLLFSAESDLRNYNFAELKAATGNFGSSSFVGEGGFGKVYKGLLNDEKVPRSRSRKRLVAVKKLSGNSYQGYEEWKTEVVFLGNLRHPNIAKLLGYCFEGSELLLVYEFAAKGSLNNHLFGRGSVAHPLRWDTRLRVAIGAARGLAFLHTSETPVIYRDVKSSNILLDAAYNAKLSDFGLAKLGPVDASHVTTRILGTYGYAAPEYVATGHLSVKSDVYGFGVLLLEILTGLVVVDRNRPKRKHNLVEWAKPRLLNKHKVIATCDSKAHYPSNSASEIAEVIVHCINNDPKQRPSMTEVVDALEKIEGAG